MVAAVKREMLEDYERIFSACGISPFFTLAALARAAFYAAPSASRGAILHIGRTGAELVSFEQSGPVAIRLLPWGGENLTRALQEELGLNREEAEKLKRGENTGAKEWSGALEPAVALLVPWLKPLGAGATISLTGKPARDPSLAPLLRQLLGEGFSCANLEVAAGNEGTPALAGLKKSAANPSAFPLLLLDAKEDTRVVAPDGLAAWKWAAAAAVLALIILCFPYLESVLLAPRLEKKLASLNAEKGRLETIDEELAFLQNLKQEQPPYLDALYLLAVTDFRSKLIDSGWFANVVVEEQTPTQDRHVSVRMTAQLKPLAARKELIVESSAKKTTAEKEPPTKSGTATNSPAAVKPKS